MLTLLAWTLGFVADANQAGQFFANAAAVLLFDSGTQTLMSGSMFSGTGSVLLTNAAGFVARPGVTVSINGPAFQLSGLASLSGSPVQGDGPGIYTISSAFTWAGGSMQNATVTAYGPLNITGAPIQLVLNIARLVTYGPTTWDATKDITMTASSIDNFGTFQVKNGQIIDDLRPMGAPFSVFFNDDDGNGHRGTVTKLFGGVSTFNVQFTNHGTLALNGLSMTFTEALTQSGANSATQLGGGTLKTTLDFEMNGGTLTAPGTITGGLQMGGMLQFSGATGALTVTADYTETSIHDTILLRIGGNQATQYDQITVRGKAVLKGSLHLMPINGFMPAATDSFTVLTERTGLTGTWTVDPGWVPTYNAGDVTLKKP